MVSTRKILELMRYKDSNVSLKMSLNAFFKDVAGDTRIYSAEWII
jgi:hypothetical protein